MSSSATHNGRIAIGTHRRIAYALSLWPGPRAPRAVIRAVVPDKGRKTYTQGRYASRRGRGDFGAGDNRATRQFQEALRHFASDGLIERTETHIVILDRAALRARALIGGADPRCPELASVAAVVTKAVGA